MNINYIYDAVRTPEGKAKKEAALASLGPDDLVAAIATSLSQRTNTKLSPNALILGTVG